MGPAGCPYHPDDQGCGDDREIWRGLAVFVAHHPVLAPTVRPIDAETLGLARGWMAHTVRELRAFADALEARASQGDPATPGSAKAVALSVVMMCRAFIRNWADARWSTPAQVLDFNRDVDMLRRMLDGLASRELPS
ncbi:hypothetical protein GTS_33600 [Gandjariella thermophila]|uniref:Uncharacterized protein n=2 Tax=Gandjariella thermophila TaxID=1931992 RepID=A0A4D4JCV0_9PSEU|nr:hypothetical protein GTS_33600 [Gandjariella thermophila]